MSGSNPNSVWNAFGLGPAPLTGAEVFLASQNGQPGATMFNYTSNMLLGYFGPALLSSPPPIGNVTPNTGAFTTLSASSRAVAPEFQIDTNYYLTISTDPFINMDDNDFIAYRRLTNKFDFAIGGVTELFIDATGVTATGPISAAGGTFSTASISGALSVGSTATLHRAIVGTDVTMLSIGGPRITAGTGVPASTVPKGTIFLRTDGAVGSTLYVSQGGGVWNAVAAV